MTIEHRIRDSFDNNAPRTTEAELENREAFTLIELLVVLAVIGVLMALLLPALSAAKAKGLSISCLSNLKQFGMAFHLYTGDHNEHVLPNAGGQGIPLGQTWVEGWLGQPGPDCTNLLYLQRSLVAPYITALGVWRCPAMPDPTVGGVTMPRVRTISMNHFMGAPFNSPGVATFHVVSDIVRPSPSDALVFLEERIDTINDAAFAVQVDFDESHPSGWVLRDKPGIAHKAGCNLTFADGHAVRHAWADPRTLSAPRGDTILGNNKDILWLHEHCTAP